MTVKELKPIADADLLDKVKSGLNLNGNDYQDDTVTVWINEVKQDLLYAGVSLEVLGSTLAVGCITRGVDEYWLSRREKYTDRFWGMAQRLKDTKVEGA